MCDDVWRLVLDQLWEAMKPLLGEDCVLEPSFFAWSLKKMEKPKKPASASEMKSCLGDAASSTNQQSDTASESGVTGHREIGQSFGLPHRDYPASESWFIEQGGGGVDGNADGTKGTPGVVTDAVTTIAPKLLNVWIPLNDVTLDNGCIHVLPREFDTCFAHPDDPE